MREMVKFLFMCAFVIGLVLGLYWLFWILWTWAVPQLWPSGPESFINPGYWLFCAMLFLTAFIGKTIFGK